MQGENKTDNRPDPDVILERIYKASRGKLTVFLGAAAGVGKTYTMLETAYERLSEGADVVIGWIETHGRQETEKLAQKIPRIPAQELEYRGKMLAEMDTDAILRRKPEIVLVDELAHTNIPGARHTRRFQDVEELLRAGVNVYTTINIQHIESLNDIVAQITGVVVRETVPDYIIEQADIVQLIDIPPEDLLKRLQEGKVYVPAQAERAMHKFFRLGNISALRELSLRFTANRVDKDLKDYMRENNIDGPWPAAGRVMVCVSASPFSAQLIRAARRLAEGLHSDWLAVHIETPNRRFPMGDKERDRIVYNMRLAEELGAKTLTVTGQDLVTEILDVARSNNVTAIVIGKPRHGRLRELIYGSVVDDLIRASGFLNIYVIQAKADSEPAAGVKTVPVKQPVNWLYYAGGLMMTAVVTALGLLLEGNIEIVNIALLYQVPVTLSAFWWGRWPSYFTAVASVLAFDFLFIPPVLTFTVHDIRYLWSFLTFLVVAFAIGGRTEHLRHEAALARKREKATRTLYAFSREIAAVIDLKTIVAELARHVAETLDKKVIVLLPDSGGRLIVLAQHSTDSGKQNEAGNAGLLEIGQPIGDSAESAVALWAYEHAQSAGRSTETLPGAAYIYIPLVTRDHVVGVLGIRLVEKHVTPEQRQLMDAWTGIAALAIERVKLSEKAREAAVLAESERLRAALFNSISHEIKTPLSTIIGSVTSLLDAEITYSAGQRRELLENVRDGAARMERVLANLLDTARLESGMMQLKYDWCDIEDIIGTALRRIGDIISRRKLEVRIPQTVPLVYGDCVLLELVLVNLIDNAIKYSLPDSTITITAGYDDETVTIAVADRGVGVPVAELDRIFDKFYRVRQPDKTVGGTGLGLSICKGIVEAHGGKIWAENRAGGGITVSFSLPVKNKVNNSPEKNGGNACV